MRQSILAFHKFFCSLASLNGKRRIHFAYKSVVQMLENTSSSLENKVNFPKYPLKAEQNKTRDCMMVS